MAENTEPQGSGSMTVNQSAQSFLGLMDAPQESEQEAPEEQMSQEEEAEPEEAPQEEEAPEPQRFRVKAAGEEREVTFDELVDGYQKGLDYTKKSQTLAEQRKAVESERLAVEQAKQARDAYAQRLNLIEQFLTQQNQGENLEALKESDPIGYAVKFAEKTEREQQLARVKAERERLLQQQYREQQAQLAQRVESERQRVTEIIPDYGHPEKGNVIKKQMRDYATSLGFSENELSQAYDSRMIQALWEASQYRKLQAQKPDVTKKVQEAPRMLKPGVAATQKAAGDEQTKKAHAQLRKSGKVSDAAALFERLL
jgi:hypothetical protein